MTELYRDVIPYPRAWRSAELEGGKAAIARDLNDAELAGAWTRPWRRLQRAVLTSTKSKRSISRIPCCPP